MLRSGWAPGPRVRTRHRCANARARRRACALALEEWGGAWPSRAAHVMHLVQPRVADRVAAACAACSDPARAAPDLTRRSPSLLWPPAGRPAPRRGGGAMKDYELG